MSYHDYFADIEKRYGSEEAFVASLPSTTCYGWVYYQDMAELRNATEAGNSVLNAMLESIDFLEKNHFPSREAR